MEKQYVYFGLAVLCFGTAFINFCGGCTGWNMINPACYAGQALCTVFTGFVKFILIGFGIVLAYLGLKEA